jgi:hypothetical protein
MQKQKTRNEKPKTQNQKTPTEIFGRTKKFLGTSFYWFFWLRYLDFRTPKS